MARSGAPSSEALAFLATMARQRRGTGTMRRRGNRWECRIRLAEGQVSFYGRTQAEAQAKADEARRERRFVASHAPTTRDWLATWLGLIRGSVAVATWRTYERHGRLYIVPSIGDVRVDVMTPEDVDRLHAYASRRVTGNTSAQIHRTLSIALNAASRRGYRVTGALQAVDRPRTTKREIVPLTWDEVAQLLVAAKGDPFEGAYALAVLHGLREGEILGLRWEFIDLQRRTVRVAASVTTDHDGVRTLTSPKTDRGRRTLDLSQPVVEALMRTPRRGALVWPAEDGSPMARSTFYKRWLQMCERAELRPVRFHDLRHSAATLAIGDGVPIQLVSKMLGHATPGFTYNTYAHVDAAGMSAVVDRINARFGPRVRIVEKTL